ncbi:General secretion pathway M protein [Sphingobium chlorophenolicum L-1]|uniref:General secretion pathway M protein n=1 Tax=Sphingobium chlorophenolicum L-1 TaxID=690566 RepID=F6EWI8_SPHCR|nr:type II secretion system protein M [Sphingobium chlorophenolicum]AEG48960.1 General secretion pathway M protein [Sphingobium chlorophenolicum L-1]
MMERLKILWDERSSREQWMLGVMFALLAVVILWLGVLRPLDAAQRSASDALREATDRNAAIRAKVKLLKSLPRPSTATDVPLEQFISQSAAEAGLTLERAQAHGANRLDMAIASVRPVALFSWLAVLEAQGVRVETMSARPSPTSGSISVQAVLARGGGQ